MQRRRRACVNKETMMKLRQVCKLVSSELLARYRHATGVALANCLALFSGATLAEEYRLGTADKVHIKVVEFNRDTLVPTEWVILTGDYTVDGAGTIVMPIIGSIVASGLSVPDLNAAIEARVRKLIGFEESAPEEPVKDGAETVLTASVEVVEYRPFFVAGNVKAPGAYPYRPGLTVLQAVSIAGGHPVAAEGAEWSLDRDTINAQGTLRSLDLEETALLARQARLRAELASSTSIEFGPVAAAGGTKDTAAAIESAKNSETAIFERRQTEIARQADALLQQKALLENEVQSLQEQIDAQNVQAKLVTAELKTVTSLVEQGLTTSSRRLTIDRMAAEIRSKTLELQTAMIQVRQAISRSERERSALLDKRQSDVAGELQDVQNSIDELGQKRSTTLSLLAMLQASGSTTMTSSQLRTIYSIVRVDKDDQSTEVIDVPETTHVEPGDTVKVTIEVPNQSALLPSATATP